MQPFDRAERNEAVGASNNDAVDRTVGTAEAERDHSFFDGERRAAMICQNGHRAVSNDKATAIDPDAGIVAGDRQHAVLDAAVEDVVGDHGGRTPATRRHGR